MANDQLALVLLAAFWAGTSAVMSGIKLMNDTRDRIFIGLIDGKELSLEHRYRLLNSDWVPMRLALGSVSLVLAFIIVMLPRLANAETMKPSLPMVCYVAAFVPFAGFLYFILMGIMEYRLIRRTLRESEAQQQA